MRIVTKYHALPAAPFPPALIAQTLCACVALALGTMMALALIGE